MTCIFDFFKVNILHIFIRTGFQSITTRYQREFNGLSKLLSLASYGLLTITLTSITETCPEIYRAIARALRETLDSSYGVCN